MRDWNSISRQARVSSTRSPDGLRAPIGPKNWNCSIGWMPAGGALMPPNMPPRPLRRRPTASISSMKIMHWPPHLRARRRARQISAVTTITSTPMNVCAKPEPGIVMIGELKLVAIAFESIVLPVPGAPISSRPRSGLPPAFLNSSPADHSVMTRSTSALGSFCPRTSSSLTPQSASPGS